MSTRTKTIPCPACNMPFPDAPAGPGISLSRYADIRICSACGTREALLGFFWLDRGRKAGLIKDGHIAKKIGHPGRMAIFTKPTKA